jgi:hypothetical protein
MPFETKRTTERLEQARRLYAQANLRIKDAAKLVGIAESTLSIWARREGWPERPSKILSAREAGASWKGKACPGLLDCPERKAQVAKAWAAAEAHIEAITALGLAEPEKSARALALVVRALRELSELDAAATGRVAADTSLAEARDDEVFDDVDSLRADLARRLEAIAAGEGSTIPGEPDGEGDASPAGLGDRGA